MLDSGGCVTLDHFAGFMIKYRQSDMGPIEEYCKLHGRKFDTWADAQMGAFIAYLVGSTGGRTTVLMAYVDEVIPVPSAPGQARVEGMRERIKGFLRPVAIRACGEHTMDRQPFLDF